MSQQEFQPTMIDASGEEILSLFCDENWQESKTITYIETQVLRLYFREIQAKSLDPSAG